MIETPNINRNASTTPPAAPAVTLVEVSKLYAGEIMLEIEATAAA